MLHFPPRPRRTRILATLGPASSTPEMIHALFIAGVDMFRLNFSHGTAETHGANVKSIRAIEAELGRPIGILADLQGPKLRVGKIVGDRMDIKAGQILRLDLDPTPGDATRVPLLHPEVIAALDVGQRILLDDGKVRMVVVEKGSNFLMAEITAGQKLSNNKGFNIPDVVLPIPALTEKDRRDLVVALDLGADWIAQSFVQRPEDVIEAKELIQGRAALMIKLEKPSALACLAEMIAVADGVMLARGDLGVEIPPEEVPAVQKQVVRMVRAAGKPIVVATQMLESMIESPAPTRAEASDVANAVYDGTDAVMLSAETAAGQYPIEAVTIMDKICQRVESDAHYRQTMLATTPAVTGDISSAITAAAHQVTRDIGATCIATYTSSGATTLRAARQRPAVPILCLTNVQETARRLAISYGVHAVVTEKVDNFADAVKIAVRVTKAQHLAEPGDSIVMTAGVPFGQAGSTNIVRVAKIT
ncbi:MAG: pyruvate kinase [Pseudomonadota bacterium]